MYFAPVTLLGWKEQYICPLPASQITATSACCMLDLFLVPFWYLSELEIDVLLNTSLHLCQAGLCYLSNEDIKAHRFSPSGAFVPQFVLHWLEEKLLGCSEHVVSWGSFPIKLAKTFKVKGKLKSLLVVVYQECFDQAVHSKGQAVKDKLLFLVEPEEIPSCWNPLWMWYLSVSEHLSSVFRQRQCVRGDVWDSLGRTVGPRLLGLGLCLFLTRAFLIHFAKRRKFVVPLIGKGELLSF